MFTLIAQLAIILMHNQDKAMLVMLAAAVTAVFFISRTMPKTGNEEDSVFEPLLLFARNMFPFTPVIVICTMAVFFAAAAYLYKRREK